MNAHPGLAPEINDETSRRDAARPFAQDYHCSPDAPFYLKNGARAAWPSVPKRPAVLAVQEENP
ncbi:hypothetical protein C9I57_11530 [Trinickia symbiotica]|uniref:Uncharacterized protein n=1 Tax=Trinickia symbiotica TaxID=863227 RepID=A0A2T3XVD7_9BURK|nr:hypothetical protein C9I57_11530 [Trinickia symbiotica]